MEPSDTQILEALESSGFLFEQECATALEEAGFHVETSWPFADQDSGKSRELDLRAIRNIHQDESAKIQVFVELLVECKDFEAPLVFLSRHKNKRELDHPSPNEFRFPRPHYRQQLGHNSYREVSGFEHFELASQHYYYKEPKKVTQFVKIVRKGSQWSANHDGVHDGIVLPLAKALETRKSELPTGTPGNDSWCSLWLFFPIVLVRGRLLLRDLGSSVPFEDRGRVSYVRGLDSKPLHGSYLIDFVRFHHLQTYLESEVMAFASSVSSLAFAKAASLRNG